MKYIQSEKNPQIKQWKKLLTRKEREKTGTFLVEGFHLVEEALKAEAVETIILKETIELPKKWKSRNISYTIVTADAFQTLSETENSQGIIAVCKQLPMKKTAIKGSQFLLIDAVQDPGNLGTIIRTADAAGIDVVIVGSGSVDVYNAKVLRSAQGSHFHLPIIHNDLLQWIQHFKKINTPVYGTSLQNGKNYTEIPCSKRFALLVGNEGNGVNEELLAETTANLYIPLFGKSESLNVAVATGILLYALKQF
ncbi:RNA methyltransferase [Bacillaceae bacterium Marseille-Q3522]|nr:RNA methyltransferase [Bacillaceae bacterium Marseille-Q3522]